MSYLINFAVAVSDKHYDVITFILKRPRVANFADIINVETMKSMSVFLDTKKVVDFWEKKLMPAELKRCVS